MAHNFRTLREASNYLNRNNYNNAAIFIGNENIPVNKREYNIDLPNITVTPQKYDSSFDGSLENFTNTINAMTGGAINRLSPSQNIRAGIDIFGYIFGNKSREDLANSIIFGNNGIVTDNFANKHPIVSTLLNAAVDGINYRNLYSLDKLTGGIGFNPLKSEFSRRVLHNVKPPMGYDLTMLAASPFVAGYNLFKGTMPNIDKPIWRVLNNTMKRQLQESFKVNGEDALKYRDNAWRKYLGLEQTPTHQFVRSRIRPDTYTVDNILNNIDNKSLQYIHSGTQGSKDFVTSSGGNLNLTVNPITNDANNNRRAIVNMTDVWDLMPGQKIDRDIKRKINNAAKNTIKLGDKLEKLGYKANYYSSKIGKRYYNDNNKLVYTANLPRNILSRIIEHGAHRPLVTIGRNTRKLGNKFVQEAYNVNGYKFNNTKLSNWLRNTEWGQVVGGKPFTISYDFPITYDNKTNKAIKGLITTPTPIDNKVYRFNQMHL